jgi:precorrin-2 dehydrogenase
MNYYPIFLDLIGRPGVVVGGGAVATRSVEALLAAEARVTVISPEVTAIIQEYANAGELRYIKRPYRGGDLEGYFLAYAATGASELECRMAAEAWSAGVLLNVVDRPVLCDFITPTLVQRGDLSIAISTNGKWPGFAKRVRKKIESIIERQLAAAVKSAAARRNKRMNDTALPRKLRSDCSEQTVGQTLTPLNEKEIQPCPPR